MKFRFSLAAASLLALSALTAPVATAQDELNGAPDSSHDKPAHGRGRTRNAIGHAGTGAVVQGNGINYHGGPVMHGIVHLYFIWYGNWAQDAKANTILSAWATNIGGSQYEAINTTYGDSTGNVSGAITFAGSTTSTLSLGTSLTDSNIASIVSNALTSGALPVDANGVYFVLTAPGVAETSGFLTQYCGWHTYGTLNGTPIKYAFVGDAAGSSLGNCAEQTSNSPNGDPAVDAMVSVMSHELEEAASDPQLNAWYDSSGEENADKCAWTFGTTYHTSNGSLANVNLGGLDYLIQQNWLNANGGYCTMSYTVTPDFSLSVSPTSQTVPSTGGAAAYTITETNLNGFTGSVTYAESGLPAWAAASFSGLVLTATVPAGTTAGSYPFTITGTSSGSLVHSVSATLVVSAAAKPTFTISISPTSRTVTRPGSATYTVTITPQNGFNSSVSLSASGAKTGLTLNLSPTSVAGGNGTSTLTATVTTSARRATDTLTVTGTGGGVTKSASTSLRVQ